MCEHLIPSWWPCLGRLLILLRVKPHWRKWVTGYRPWSVIAQPHFLLTLCFLSVDIMWLAGLLPLPQCLLHGDGLSLPDSDGLSLPGTTRQDSIFSSSKVAFVRAFYLQQQKSNQDAILTENSNSFYFPPHPSFRQPLLHLPCGFLYSTMLHTSCQSCCFPAGLVSSGLTILQWGLEFLPFKGWVIL